MDVTDDERDALAGDEDGHMDYHVGDGQDELLYELGHESMLAFTRMELSNGRNLNHDRGMDCLLCGRLHVSPSYL